VYLDKKRLYSNRIEPFLFASDLEPKLSIENGLLKIYYQFTRSNQSYTFEFNNNQMVIIHPESNGVESAIGNFENDKYYFKKGEIISETGNISNE
jgi:hypothetical protein